MPERTLSPEPDWDITSTPAESSDDERSVSSDMPELVAGSPSENENEVKDDDDKIPELVPGSAFIDDVNQNSRFEPFEKMLESLFNGPLKSFTVDLYYLYNFKGTPVLSQDDTKSGDYRRVASFSVFPNSPFHMFAVPGADMSFVMETVKDISLRLTPQEDAPFWKHTLELRQKGSERVQQVEEQVFGCRELGCGKLFQNEHFLRLHGEKRHTKFWGDEKKLTSPMKALAITDPENPQSDPTEAYAAEKELRKNKTKVREQEAEDKSFWEERVEQWRTTLLTPVTEQGGQGGQNEKMKSAISDFNCANENLSYQGQALAQSSVKHENKLAKEYEAPELRLSNTPNFEKYYHAKHRHLENTNQYLLRDGMSAQILQLLSQNLRATIETVAIEVGRDITLVDQSTIITALVALLHVVNMKKLVIICTEPPEDHHLFQSFLKHMVSKQHDKLEHVEIRFEGNGLQTVMGVQYLLEQLLTARGGREWSLQKNGLDVFASLKCGH